MIVEPRDLNQFVEEPPEHHDDRVQCDRSGLRQGRRVILHTTEGLA